MKREKQREILDLAFNSSLVINVLFAIVVN